ncbi:MAG: hypothetical protein EOP86_11380 [Verrucomicrobiaceae bacterium]|nr:MAG: hypothetical protein EOP86_11380 [Verrucomicrobiaceae bacterium]
MMKQRLTHETRERTKEDQSPAHDHRHDQNQRTEPVLVFDSADSMIRHDAARTEIPEQVRERVMRSIARTPLQNSKPAPWWRRWMRQ